jgi:hypothetical protein
LLFNQEQFSSSQLFISGISFGSVRNSLLSGRGRLMGDKVKLMREQKMLAQHMLNMQGDIFHEKRRIES